MRRLAESWLSDMPLKSGRLTPKERVFVKHMVATNDQTYAAEKAGYASPVMSGSRLAKSLAQNVQAEQQKRIETELLPLAVDVHSALLRDKSTPAGAKVSAVKLVYDMTIAKPDAGAAGKEPHEMNTAELQELLRQGEDRLAALRRMAADRAKPVIDAESSAIDDGAASTIDDAKPGEDPGVFS